MADEYENWRKPRTAKPSSRLRLVNITAEKTSQSMRKTGSSLSPRHQSKRRSNRSVTRAHKSFDAPIDYHPWKPEYSQVILRDKTQKTMTKESYRSSTGPFAQAKESIATEEECHPILIPTNAIHRQQAVIQYQRKSLLPTIVRYVRAKDLLPSEQSVSPTASKSSLGSTPQTTTNRILDDASVIRRPPRRLTIHTLFPLTFYD